MNWLDSSQKNTFVNRRCNFYYRFYNRLYSSLRYYKNVHQRYEMDKTHDAIEIPNQVEQSVLNYTSHLQCQHFEENITTNFQIDKC